MANFLSDVVIKLREMVPVPSMNLGVPAIFVQGTTVGYAEFNDLEAINDDTTLSTAVKAKATAIFNQTNTPPKVAVITFATGAIATAATAYAGQDWHFGILATYVAADALALSNWAELNSEKIIAIQVPAVEGLTPLANNEFTIGLVHPAAEHFDAALVAEAGSQVVGSLTWKAVHDLVGVTPQTFTEAQYTAIKTARGIVYVTKTGAPQSSEGWTLSGEFIDVVHGDQWMKVRLMGALQQLITDENKVPFNPRGIALVQATITEVLNEGYQNGVVGETEAGDPAFDVQTKQRSELNSEDIAKRIYKGASFTYQRSAAIHGMDVSGTIEF
ncbi:DUF3383 family protein [Periweissella cryptocerci]|uniref:DUF3383 family protein n=1 Tax=Periweissella cryptocerci TaxID=2506420 RepID=A0A4P6YWJ2_9LACO|nr:DUF3383 family protein [Periweissella cryptocerci]QBO37279.1 DUF3383 family protein [Periweissella cryptocerci]